MPRKDLFSLDGGATRVVTGARGLDRVVAGRSVASAAAPTAFASDVTGGAICLALGASSTLVRETIAVDVGVASVDAAGGV